MIIRLRYSLGKPGTHDRKSKSSTNTSASNSLNLILAKSMLTKPEASKISGLRVAVIEGEAS
ncbi:hypothetical protein CA13_30580 [Planctomycetes bacterium CA13]|uniref:Uncharacterized protein n=1 Tax=Novipirellula herctigrandis TaxID=2527986 RepID=A0A5C5Z343_9BACT|nr:hypothetical protein CA13_30580 [Planctomycetes bacterium CA13]